MMRSGIRRGFGRPYIKDASSTTVRSFILFAIGFLVVTSVYGRDSFPDSDSLSEKKLMIREFVEAYEATNEAIGECDSEAKNTALKPGSFPTGSLDPAEVRLVIMYHGAKAEQSCWSKERGQLASAMLRLQAQGYVEDLPDPKKEKYESAQELFRSSSHFYYVKVRYLRRIPAPLRKELEQIEALKRPFNVIETEAEHGVKGPQP